MTVDECRARVDGDIIRDLVATDASCQWMKDAAGRWGGCVPCISYDEDSGRFFLDSCDETGESRASPFDYCPGCGRKLMLDG